MFQMLTLLFCTLLLFLPSPSFAQQEGVSKGQSQLPVEAGSVNNFVSPGWKIEEKVAGDLNGDSIKDYALKLIEKQSDKEDDERQRALVIVLGNKNGKLRRAAVNYKLLQCPMCGGLFYGGFAPANVRITKGVLVVEQENGSRELTSYTYRFRYEPDTGRFFLIGFDFVYRDHITVKSVSESSNYLTGVRIVKRNDGKNVKTSRENVSMEKIYIEQVDRDKFSSDAISRLDMKFFEETIDDHQ
ncbi:MAG: hypothetical protein HQK88_03470 [Nitrospirae bacterium]|nr:hypothetical protein [Nitrospirota bacterium]MBF0534225.1 hypothetical protein [Nitrospirota bacterium]MBF0615861.1 hypothetical protein [Nitrospirota bacterium]